MGCVVTTHSLIIGKALIAKAQMAGACPKALAWLHKHPRTLGQLVNEQPDWAEWAVRMCKSKAQRAYDAARTKALATTLATLWERERVVTTYRGKL